MKSRWISGMVCAAACLLPLGWHTAELWTQPPALSTAPLAGVALDMPTTEGDRAAYRRLNIEPLYSGVSAQAAARTRAWQVDGGSPLAAATRAWLATHNAVLDFGQRTPAEIIRDLAALRTTLDQPGAEGSDPPAGIAAADAEIAAAIERWRAVETSNTLAQAAQAAGKAGDYRQCLKLCREHELKFAARLDGPDAELFAADAITVRQLNVKALAEIDATTDAHRTLAVQGLAEITQLVTRAPDDLAAQIQNAYDLDHRYADPQVHNALQTWIHAGLTAFLCDRQVPNVDGMLESVSRANGHIVLGSYERRPGQPSAYWYRADPHTSARSPSIAVQLDRLDGPPRAPLFVTAARRWNAGAGVVRASPTSADAWQRLAAVCEQLEQAASRDREAAGHPSGVVPAQYTPLYQRLSFQRETAQCRALSQQCDKLRALLEPADDQ